MLEMLYLVLQIHQEEIDQGISTLNNMVGLIAGITMVSAVASKVGGSVRTFISLIGVTMAIATLTGALALLSIVDQDMLRTATEALAVASIAIVAL